jgi:6-phosphogluconolactonase (cycloisomerase 2 family)
MAASAILISHPYVYVSNRDDPSPEGDSIVIFRTSGPLEIVVEIRTGLKHLRGMAFIGEEDRYLIAGGEEGGGAKVYERIDGGVGLKEVARNESVKAPTGFLWL